LYRPFTNREHGLAEAQINFTRGGRKKTLGGRRTSGEENFQLCGADNSCARKPCRRQDWGENYCRTEGGGRCGSLRSDHRGSRNSARAEETLAQTSRNFRGTLLIKQRKEEERNHQDGTDGCFHEGSTYTEEGTKNPDLRRGAGKPAPEAFVRNISSYAGSKKSAAAELR